MTDCHYLSKSLGSKGLSAYYLGCAMADHIKTAFFDIVSTLTSSKAGIQEGRPDEGSAVEIVKVLLFCGHIIVVCAAIICMHQAGILKNCDRICIMPFISWLFQLTFKVLCPLQ